MESNKFKVNIDAMKKHAPEILHPKWLYLTAVDMSIRVKVAMMRRQGKTDDDILEAIEPIFEQYMMPLIECE